MKRNLIVMAALLLGMTTIFSSCGKDKPDTSKEGLYVGIIGFNDHLQSKTMKILSDNTKGEMTDFINQLTSQNGTVLYHAVNTALDKIEEITPPEDLINVSIVTFTDGLDNGSYMLNNNYNDGNEYLSAVSNRIRNTFIGDNKVPISAYSIGVKGSDVGDNESSFIKNLNMLSSNASSNVFLLDNMNQISQTFSDIATDLYHQSSSWDVTLKAAVEPGTRIRFTFDSVNSADESQAYIEGVYSDDNGTKVLSSINYVGLNNCGDIIYPTVDGIFLAFTFSDLYYLNGDPVYTNTAKQWYWENNTWRINSEFTTDGNTNTQEEYKSAIVMLVLDCSNSLGNDFQSVKSAACQFIETLNRNTHQGTR